ncbi:hypothetical protein SDC9_174396 [bioreactor metagenome]|uniref:Uncharacterized protein n=1 Tax=bioreactor metagenome TaxID=1076179 RepID=A0A645GM69_9ZZZZ
MRKPVGNCEIIEQRAGSGQWLTVFRRQLAFVGAVGGVFNKRRRFRRRSLAQPLLLQIGGTGSKFVDVFPGSPHCGTVVGGEILESAAAQGENTVEIEVQSVTGAAVVVAAERLPEAESGSGRHRKLKSLPGFGGGKDIQRQFAAGGAGLNHRQRLSSAADA